MSKRVVAYGQTGDLSLLWPSLSTDVKSSQVIGQFTAIYMKTVTLKIPFFLLNAGSSKFISNLPKDRTSDFLIVRQEHKARTL